MPDRVLTAPCFGQLFSETDADCNICLIRENCKTTKKTHRAVAEVRAPIGDKKLLVLQVCQKYGISTSYKPKKSDEVSHITLENYQEWTNLDFLLTNQAALEKLLDY